MQFIFFQNYGRAGNSEIYANSTDILQKIVENKQNLIGYFKRTKALKLQNFKAFL